MTAAVARTCRSADSADGPPLRWWQTMRFMADPRYRSDPYPLYSRLQSTAPVLHSPLGVTLVSGHDEIVEVLRSPLTSAVDAEFDFSLGAGRHGRGLLAELPARLVAKVILQVHHSAPTGDFVRMAQRFLIQMDPPDHTRIRSLASRAFTPRVAEDARPMIEAITSDALDDLEAAASTGDPVDLIESLAYRIPIEVICRLLGVPVEDHSLVCGWVPALVAGLDLTGLLSKQAVADADRAAAAISAYFLELAEIRRSDPADDLFSRLVQAGQDGDTLSSEELVAFAALLFAAGHETTANLIGNGVWNLHTHPDQKDRWRHEPDIRRQGVDELLRFDSPIQLTQRIAKEPMTVGGLDIVPGRQMTLLLGAGNRDPRIHDRPAVLDLGRADSRPLSFGFGIHHCIGAALARVEAEVALGALYDRFPGVRPVATTPAWRSSIIFRGLSELPVMLA